MMINELPSQLEACLKLLNHQNLTLSERVPNLLLDWLGELRAMEKELLVRTMASAMPAWFPFEGTLIPQVPVWSGDAEATYLLLRALLLAEQSRSLSGPSIVNGLLKKKAALQSLDLTSSLLTQLVNEYIDNAANLPWQQKIRIALTIRWAKWIGGLTIDRQVKKPRQRFQTAFSDLVDADLHEGSYVPLLSRQSLLDILDFGRGLGTEKGVASWNVGTVSWNVVPTRWFRRDPNTKVRTGEIATWEDVRIVDINEGQKTVRPAAPLHLLCEIVFYPFIEPISTLREKLGLCYLTGMIPKDLPAAEVSKMFLGSSTDEDWHFSQVGASSWNPFSDPLTKGVL